MSICYMCLYSNFMVLHNMNPLGGTTQREALKVLLLYYLTTSKLLPSLTATLGLRIRTSMMVFIRIQSIQTDTVLSGSTVETQKSSILSQKSMILGTRKILSFAKARMHPCFLFQQQPSPFLTCLVLKSQKRMRSQQTL